MTDINVSASGLLERVQAAYTTIDAVWCKAEGENRPANVDEANFALQELATALGLEEPDGVEGDPLISLALAVTGYLKAALLAAHEPGNPADEYERLLRAAEEEAPRNPAAALVLLKTADRWMNDELSAARALHKPHGIPEVTP